MTVSKLKDLTAEKLATFAMPFRADFRCVPGLLPTYYAEVFAHGTNTDPIISQKMPRIGDPQGWPSHARQTAGRLRDILTDRANAMIYGS